MIITLVQIKGGRMHLVLLGSLFLLLLTGSSFSQQLAFPTAEGSGRFAKGGRGGDVYEVTNLNNSGPGSIVDAVSQPNRTIVFRVSGTITLGDKLLQPKSNTTIAGQTAPGDGICIKGRIIIYNYHDIIIRYIRVRVDEGGVNADGDAIDIAGCNPENNLKVSERECKNIIVDHVSASFSRDELISCRQYNDSVTVQWCILSEALSLGASHSFGSLVRGELGQQKTYHHNLYAHNLGRNPRPGNYTKVTEDPEGLYFDFRNNVIYNWDQKKPGYNEDKPEENTMSRYNFIGNAYVPGPQSATAKYTEIFKESCAICQGYFENNSYDGVVPKDQWSLVRFQDYLTESHVTGYKNRSEMLTMEPVTTTSPEQALADVLASSGANFPKRDIIDQRIVKDVKNKSGTILDFTTSSPEGGWPELKSLPAPVDSDHDGMPDEWENKYGLNPNNADDRNSKNSNGFTMLEEYLNSLVSGESANIDNVINPKQNQLGLKTVVKINSNPTISLQYYAPSNTFVRLWIYDALGNKVKKLVDGKTTKGIHTLQLNKKDLPSGTIFTHLQVGTHAETVKLVNIN